MLGAQHLHRPLPRLCAPLSGLEYIPRLPFRDPPHRRPQLPSEHQDVISLCPVLLRLIPAGDGEVLFACAQGFLHKNPMTTVFPSVQPLFYPPSDGVLCGDMLVLLQDYRLEDNEPLRVLLYFPHPPQLSPQRLNK